MTEIDECFSNPCLNGGRCVDEVNGYSCECMNGFNGKDCKTNIDDCASNPCQNNAVCLDFVSR